MILQGPKTSKEPNKGSPCGKGPIPPVRGKCPEGTKRVGMLAP